MFDSIFGRSRESGPEQPSFDEMIAELQVKINNIKEAGKPFATEHAASEVDGREINALEDRIEELRFFKGYGVEPKEMDSLPDLRGALQNIRYLRTDMEFLLRRGMVDAAKQREAKLRAEELRVKSILEQSRN